MNNCYISPLPRFTSQPSSHPPPLPLSVLPSPPRLSSSPFVIPSLSLPSLLSSSCSASLRSLRTECPPSHSPFSSLLFPLLSSPPPSSFLLSPPVSFPLLARLSVCSSHFCRGKCLSPLLSPSLANSDSHPSIPPPRESSDFLCYLRRCKV